MRKQLFLRLYSTLESLVMFLDHQRMRLAFYIDPRFGLDVTEIELEVNQIRAEGYERVLQRDYV